MSLAENILKRIKSQIFGDNMGIGEFDLFDTSELSEMEISPFMYDPYLFQDKVSLALMQKMEDGSTRLRFRITVEDVKAYNGVPDGESD